MNFHRSVKTTIATFTVVVFFLTSLGISPNVFAAAAMPEVSLPYQAKINENLRISIPQELGKLEHFEKGQGPAIFHIQDAHGHYEGQQKIRQLLEFLAKTYGVTTVLVEGSAFRLDPDKIRFFPENMKKTLAVNEEFTRHAWVAGVELHLLQDTSSQAWGIEESGSYQRNGRSFVNVLTQKEKTAQFLAGMNTQIERISSHLLNKDLRDFLVRVEVFEKNEIPFDTWLAQLKDEAQKRLGIDLASPAYQLDWPMLVRIFKAQELSKKMDRNKFPGERDEFLKAIRRFFPRDAQRATANASVFSLSAIKELLKNESMSQQLLDPETSLLFEDMAKRLPPDFNYDRFPNVRSYIGMLLLQSELKAGRLMKEVQALSEAITEKLTRTAGEKELVALLADHRLLQKLFALELTPADYEAILARNAQRSTRSGKALKPSIIVKRFQGLARSALSVARVKEMKFEHVKDLDQLFDSAMRFYEGVKERDGKMEARIEERLKETGATKAVVITGGFHSQPMEDYFLNKGYSYALITPKLFGADKQGHTDYVKAVLATLVPAKKTYKNPFVFTTLNPQGDGASLMGIKASVTGALQAMVQNGALTRDDMRTVIQKLSGGTVTPAVQAMRSESRSEVDPETAAKIAERWKRIRYMESDLEGVKNRAKADREGEAFLANAQRQIRAVAEQIHLDPKVLEKLLQFEKIIRVKIPLTLDEGGEAQYIDGWRIGHNGARGPYKGGIRYAIEVMEATIKALATEMSVKNAIAGLPYGGGKGGVAINPKELSVKELARLTRGYVSECLKQDPKTFGALLDVPAGDIGTTSREMGWFADEFLKITQPDLFDTEEFRAGHAKSDETGLPYLEYYMKKYYGKRHIDMSEGSPIAVVTAKPEGKETGGAKGRTPATGLGLYYVTREALKVYGERQGIGTSVNGQRIAIEAYGNVGSYAARSFRKDGAKIMTIKEVVGSDFRPVAIMAVKDSGIDLDALDKHLAEKNADGKSKGNNVLTYVKEHPEDAREVTVDEFWASDVTVMALAARQKTVNQRIANLIRAKIISEGANGPLEDAETEKILLDKGAIVLCDVFTNDGGVAFSSLEWRQNNIGELWPEVAGNGLMEDKVVNAFYDISRVSESQKISLREAAYQIAISRIVDAMLAADPQLASSFDDAHPAYVMDAGAKRWRPETLPELNQIETRAARHNLIVRADEVMDRKINELVTEAVAKLPAKRGSVVMIGGPRASGKPILSERIVEKIHEKGIKAKLLDLDFQTAEDVSRALQGKEIPLRKENGQNGGKFRLDPDEILVVTGYFAISDDILGMVKAFGGEAFPVMAYSSPDILLANNWALTAYDLRLMRDILSSIAVGDEANVQEVIRRWKWQRIAETEAVFNTWKNAKHAINTYVPYELPFLKSLVGPMIKVAVNQEASNPGDEGFTLNVLRHLDKLLTGVEGWDVSLLSGHPDSILWPFVLRYASSSSTTRSESRGVELVSGAQKQESYQFVVPYKIEPLVLDSEDKSAGQAKWLEYQFGAEFADVRELGTKIAGENFSIGWVSVALHRTGPGEFRPIALTLFEINNGKATQRLVRLDGTEDEVSRYQELRKNKFQVAAEAEPQISVKVTPILQKGKVTAFELEPQAEPLLRSESRQIPSLKQMLTPDHFMEKLKNSAGFSYLSGFDHVEVFRPEQAAIQLDSGEELVFRRMSRSHYYTDNGPVSPFHFILRVEKNDRPGQSMGFELTQEQSAPLRVFASLMIKGRNSSKESSLTIAHHRDLAILGFDYPEANRIVAYAPKESVLSISERFKKTSFVIGQVKGQPFTVEFIAVPEDFFVSAEGKELFRRHAATRGTVHWEQAKIGSVEFKDGLGRPDSDFLQKIEMIWDRASAGKVRTDIFVFLEEFFARVNDALTSDDGRDNLKHALSDVSRDTLYRGLALRIAMEGPTGMKIIEQGMNYARSMGHYRNTSFMQGFLVGFLTEEVRRQLNTSVSTERSEVRTSVQEIAVQLQEIVEGDGMENLDASARHAYGEWAALGLRAAEKGRDSQWKQWALKLLNRIKKENASLSRGTEGIAPELPGVGANYRGQGAPEAKAWVSRMQKGQKEHAASVGARNAFESRFFDGVTSRSEARQGRLEIPLSGDVSEITSETPSLKDRGFRIFRFQEQSGFSVADFLLSHLSSITALVDAQTIDAGYNVFQILRLIQRAHAHLLYVREGEVVAFREDVSSNYRSDAGILINPEKNFRLKDEAYAKDATLSPYVQTAILPQDNMLKVEFSGDLMILQSPLVRSEARNYEGRKNILGRIIQLEIGKRSFVKFDGVRGLTERNMAGAWDALVFSDMDLKQHLEKEGLGYFSGQNVFKIFDGAKGKELTSDEVLKRVASSVTAIAVTLRVRPQGEEKIPNERYMVLIDDIVKASRSEVREKTDSHVIDSRAVARPGAVLPGMIFVNGLPVDLDPAGKKAIAVLLTPKGPEESQLTLGDILAILRIEWKPGYTAFVQKVANGFVVENSAQRVPTPKNTVNLSSAALFITTQKNTGRKSSLAGTSLIVVGTALHLTGLLAWAGSIVSQELINGKPVSIPDELLVWGSVSVGVWPLLLGVMAIVKFLKEALQSYREHAGTESKKIARPEVPTATSSLREAAVLTPPADGALPQAVPESAKAAVAATHVSPQAVVPQSRLETPISGVDSELAEYQRIMGSAMEQIKRLPAGFSEWRKGFLPKHERLIAPGNLTLRNIGPVLNALAVYTRELKRSGGNPSEDLLAKAFKQAEQQLRAIHKKAKSPQQLALEDFVPAKPMARPVPRVAPEPKGLAITFNMDRKPASGKALDANSYAYRAVFSHVKNLLEELHIPEELWGKISVEIYISRPVLEKIQQLLSDDQLEMTLPRGAEKDNSIQIRFNWEQLSQLPHGFEFDRLQRHFVIARKDDAVSPRSEMREKSTGKTLIKAPASYLGTQGVELPTDLLHPQNGKEMLSANSLGELLGEIQSYLKRYGDKFSADAGRFELGSADQAARLNFYAGPDVQVPQFYVTMQIMGKPKAWWRFWESGPTAVFYIHHRQPYVSGPSVLVSFLTRYARFAEASSTIGASSSSANKGRSETRAREVMANGGIDSRVRAAITQKRIDGMYINRWPGFPLKVSHVLKSWEKFVALHPDFFSPSITQAQVDRAYIQKVIKAVHAFRKSEAKKGRILWGSIALLGTGVFYSAFFMIPPHVTLFMTLCLALSVEALLLSAIQAMTFSYDEGKVLLKILGDLRDSLSLEGFVQRMIQGSSWRELLIDRGFYYETIRVKGTGDVQVPNDRYTELKLAYEQLRAERPDLAMPEAEEFVKAVQQDGGIGLIDAKIKEYQGSQGRSESRAEALAAQLGLKWDLIRRNGLFAFDMQKTLVERKEKVSDGMRDFLIWLLSEGVPVIVISANSREEIWQQLMEPILSELQARGKLSVIENMLIYANSGTSKYWVDRKGRRHLDVAFSKQFLISHEVERAVQEGLKALAKQGFFIQPEEFQAFREIYEKDRVKDGLTTEFHFPWMDLNMDYEPSIIAHLKNEKIVQAPYIVRRGILEGIADQQGTALAIRQFLPGQREKVWHALEDALASHLEEASQLMLRGGGLSTVDLSNKKANKAFAFRDAVQFFQKKGRTVDLRQAVYHGDEVWRSPESATVKNRGNDIIMLDDEFGGDPDYKKFQVVAFNPDSPEGLSAEEQARTTYVGDEQRGTELYLGLLKKFVESQRSAASTRSEAREFVTLAEKAFANHWISEAALQNIRSWSGPEYARVHGELDREFQAAGTDAKEWSKINDAWYTKVAVGTAGMRGTLGLGTNRISEYTIGSLMLAHALSVNDPAFTKIIEQNYPEFKANGLQRAVVIAGDSRYGSYDTQTKKPGRHIKLEALINAALGIKAYVFKSPTSTPQLAWAVHELDVEPTDLIVSGSENTASHNPRTDNGNKPYKIDGSQSTGVFSDLMAKYLPDSGVAALNALTYDGLNVIENVDVAFERALANGDIRWVGGTQDDSYEDDAYHADELFVQREMQEAIHVLNGIFDNSKIDLKNSKIVISPLFGVARHILKKIIKARGLSEGQVVWVEDEPNSDFPGVEGGKPNPEEPKARLAALRKAVEVNADLVLWADPDADRPAVATKKDLRQKAVSIEDYVSFNGNQQLAILMDYLVRELKAIATEESVADDVTRTHLAEKATDLLSNIWNVFAAFSLVSADLPKIIARQNGLNVVETLVGFKYVGDQIELRSKVIQELAGITESQWQHLSNKRKIELAIEHSEAFLFGGEESLGALSSDGPHDKDALAAVMWFVEIMGRLRKDGKTLQDRLNEIYQTYGYFSERFPMLEKSKNYAGVNFSEAEAMQVIKAEEGPSIMNFFKGTPPKTIAGKKVIAVLDYDAQVARDTDGNVLFDADSHAALITAETPGIPESFRKALGKIGVYSFRHKAVRGSTLQAEKLPREKFIRFILEDGSIITPRPSGTEPKIKFYILGRGAYEDKAAVDAWVEAAAKEINTIADNVAKERFPEKFGDLPKTTRSEIRGAKGPASFEELKTRVEAALNGEGNQTFQARMSNLLGVWMDGSSNVEFRKRAWPEIQRFLRTAIGTPTGYKRIRSLAVTSDITEVETLAEILGDMGQYTLLLGMAHDLKSHKEHEKFSARITILEQAVNRRVGTPSAPFMRSEVRAMGEVAVIRRMYQEEPWLMESVTQNLRFGIVALRIMDALKKAGDLGLRVIERVSGISLASAGEIALAQEKSLTRVAKPEALDPVLVSKVRAFFRETIAKNSDAFILGGKLAFDGALPLIRPFFGDVPVVVLVRNNEDRAAISKFNLQLLQAHRAEILTANTVEEAREAARSAARLRKPGLDTVKIKALVDPTESVAIALKQAITDTMFVTGKAFENFLSRTGIANLAAQFKADFAISKSA